MSVSSSEQDAQIYQAARIILHTVGYGDVDDSFGRFSPARLGDRWLIIHEHKGTMQVLDFESAAKRNDHFGRMVVASRLTNVGVSDEQFVAALHGFRLALAEACDFAEEAIDPGWSEASQDGTRRIVLDWVTAHAIDIRTYLVTVEQSWGEAAALWVRAITQEGVTFTDYAAGETVVNLMESARRYRGLDVILGPDGLELAEYF